MEAMDKHGLDGMPVPFSLVAITCNRSKNTGGDILILTDVIQAKHQKLLPKMARKVIVTKSAVKHLPSDLQSRVRRLYIINSGEIRNVNLRLITHFNNQKIVY